MCHLLFVNVAPETFMIMYFEGSGGGGFGVFAVWKKPINVLDVDML